MPVAAITMTFNETDFLPIWLSHYGPHFGYENLFVIDDGSTDKSVHNPLIRNLIRRERMDLDEDHRALVVSYFFNELLNYYDYVIYTDVDELLVADPNLNVGLSEYILRSSDNYLTAVGLNVLHNIPEERALNTKNALFEQRSHVQFSIGNCKTLVSRVPLRFVAGFHSAGVAPNFHESLYLFHLRAVDRDIAKRRLKNLNSVRFSANSLRKRQSWQHRMTWEEYETKFFGYSADDFKFAPQGFGFSASDEWKKTGGIRHGYSGPIVRVPEHFAYAVSLADDSPCERRVLKIAPDVPLARLWNKSIENLMSRGAYCGSLNDLCPCGSGRKVKSCHRASLRKASLLRFLVQ